MDFLFIFLKWWEIKEKCFIFESSLDADFNFIYTGLMAQYANNDFSHFCWDIHELIYLLISMRNFHKFFLSQVAIEFQMEIAGVASFLLNMKLCLLS